MPIHDWTKVTAGTWHAFHLSWISEIQLSLNDGILPVDYYAQAEQIAGPLGPDVLTLQESNNDLPDSFNPSSNGGVALATAPPKTRIIAETEMSEYASKRRTIIIRHTSGDRVIALIEIMSPGNKESKRAIDSFLEKALEALDRGYHLLIVDLFPPGPRDPQGIHARLWSEISDKVDPLPPDEPLTLAAYSAGPTKRAFVEPTAVGKELMEMPLYLTPDAYVPTPLESTYQRAYRGVPRKWKAVLES